MRTIAEIVKLPTRPITNWQITVDPEISDFVVFDQWSKSGDGCGIFTNNVQNVPGLIIQALQTVERKCVK